jgi:hypothetical protein
MSTAFHTALLLHRGGVRPAPSMLFSPETDVFPSSSRRHSSPLPPPVTSPKKLRHRLSCKSFGSKLIKSKNKDKHGKNQVQPEQAPAIPLLLAKRRVQPEKAQLMRFLQTACPHDVLPNILAFCSPQTTAKLHKCNRFWHNLISSEPTWRALCEELYKVRTSLSTRI